MYKWSEWVMNEEATKWRELTFKQTVCGVLTQGRNGCVMFICTLFINFICVCENVTNAFAVQ